MYDYSVFIELAKGREHWGRGQTVKKFDSQTASVEVLGCVLLSGTRQGFPSDFILGLSEIGSILGTAICQNLTRDLKPTCPARGANIPVTQNLFDSQFGIVQVFSAQTQKSGVRSRSNVLLHARPRCYRMRPLRPRHSRVCLCSVFS